jgi:hypothetical protein
MRGVLSLVVATVFPLVLLVCLFALSYLEDTLPRDMRQARRTPDPPPILRMPVRPVAAPAPLLVSVPVAAELEHVTREAELTPAGSATLDGAGSGAASAEPQQAAANGVVHAIPQQRVPDESVRAATA